MLFHRPSIRAPNRALIPAFARLGPLLRSAIAPGPLAVMLGAAFAGPALCAAAETGATVTETGAAPAPSAQPLISLLLPLDAPDFAPPANAVQAGCNAAFSLGGPKPRIEVTRTDANPARVRDAWDAAASRGANIIIGPLTRAGASALAATLLSRPADNAPLTLTLNGTEELPRLPPRFYSFGLAIEQEARAIARMAWIEGLRAAIVVQGRGALDRRSSQAFADEWVAYGGRIVDIRDFDNASDLAELKAVLAKQSAEFVFLSASAREARAVRPYLSSQLVVFATSQVNDGRQDAGANVDLLGVRFVDMPWLLQPDHAAVMVYPRLQQLGPDLQRFYALGIDACRIAGQMLAGRNRVDIDGVTGQLTLDLRDAGVDTVASRTVTREPVPASFRDRFAAPPDGAAPAPRQ
jgi:outer membrane PBP1 activator LpoA protein